MKTFNKAIWAKTVIRFLNYIYSVKNKFGSTIFHSL